MRVSENFEVLVSLNEFDVLRLRKPEIGNSHFFSGTVESMGQERVRVYVAGSAAAVINGNDDVTTWADEELAYGRRRGAKGFSGGHPKVIPAECVRELNRRKLFETNSIIRDACTHAAQYLSDVVQGEENPNNARQNAAITILDRFLGRPVDRVQMDAKVEMKEEPVWMRIARQAITVDGIPIQDLPGVQESLGVIPVPSRVVESDDDIVDAELVEDDPVLWDD